MTQFRNLQELMTKLSDDKVCRDYLENMRWQGNPVCPHCGASKPYRLKDGKNFRCRNSECKKDFSVTVGTIFENSKIPLSKWVAAIYLLTGHKKGISSHQLGRDLGVTQKSAWFILHRVRYMFGIPEPEPLDNIVEVDETYVGGKFENMNRGRRKKWQELQRDNKTAVMGLLERGGKAKLTVIGQNNFKDVIRENVDTSAFLVTDSHLGYVGLGNEFAGHESVNHSIKEYRRDIFYTNTVEGFFSLFKRTIFGIYHQVSPKHLQQYCNESAYRYNTRKITDPERFILTMSNTDGRLTYNQLIQKNCKPEKNE